MVEANGAPPDDIRTGYVDESMADSMDWVDNDDGGISAEGGKFDDSVHAAYEHIVFPCVSLFSMSSVCHFFRNQIFLTSRDQRDQLLKLYHNWDKQKPLLVDAYLCWKHGLVDEPEVSAPASQSPQSFTVSVVETHC
jgi:hypothetical protein